MRVNLYMYVAMESILYTSGMYEYHVADNVYHGVTVQNRSRLANVGMYVDTDVGTVCLWTRKWA